MSSGWERIRIRMETNQLTPPDDDALTETRTISSHVLDTTIGRAAPNIQITLFRLENKKWERLNQIFTDENGRVAELLPIEQFQSGVYKLHFDVIPYFELYEVKTFYPCIEIVIECTRGQHYHVPLLLNPFGYTTYRGT